jgi:hypothetical protein
MRVERRGREEEDRAHIQLQQTAVAEECARCEFEDGEPPQSRKKILCSHLPSILPCLCAVCLCLVQFCSRLLRIGTVDNLKSASFSLYRSIATALVKSALLHASYGTNNVKLPPFFSSP